MIESDNCIEFIPQVRISDNSQRQKYLIDSEYIDSPDGFDEFNERILPIKKQKQSLSAKNQSNQPKNYQLGKSSKKFSIRQMFFTQSFIKSAAVKFMNLSQILQNKFKNNDLLVEQYLSPEQYNIDQNVLQDTEYIPVIQINHSILKIWQLIKFIVYLFLMWWMPFKEAFIIHKNLEIQDYILLIIMLIDILIQINKEIIVQGQLIKNRETIIEYYIKNQCALDIFYLLVYCCLIFQLVPNLAQQILEIIFFFFNLKKFQSVIQNYQESTVSSNEKLNLVELILTVLILAHFMACIWFQVGLNSLNYYNESWIIKLGLQDQQILTQYCYSFYWASATMATVGYGDITGQNLHEIFCSSVLIFFSSGIFAFTINSIGVILNNINQSQSQYKRSLLLINEHMSNNGVSSHLQTKIKNYLKFYYKSSHSTHEKEIDTIVQQLSNNLREELTKNIRSKAVMNNIFLSKQFTKHTQLSLLQNLQQITFTPNEQIYEQMSNDDHSFYIIMKGYVNIIDQNSKRIIHKLKEGDSFGEIELLTENPRYSSAYSVGFTKLLKISRSNFISIIKQDQSDFEHFHMLKDQILFKLKSPTQCSVCLQDHIIYDCNKLFYKPNLEKNIKKELFHSFQERKQQKRVISQKSKFQLSDFQYVQQRCESFRSDNNMENEESQLNVSNSNQDSLIKSKQRIQSPSQLRNIQELQSDESLILTKNQEYLLQKNYENDREDNQRSRQEKKRSMKSQRKHSVFKQQQNPISTSKYIQHQQSKISSLGHMKEEFQFIQLDFDEPKAYKTYFPLNNITNVILQYEIYLKKTQKEKYHTIPSNYRFFQVQKQKFFQSRPRLN